MHRAQITWYRKKCLLPLLLSVQVASMKMQVIWVVPIDIRTACWLISCHLKIDSVQEVVNLTRQQLDVLVGSASLSIQHSRRVCYVLAGGGRT